MERRHVVRCPLNKVVGVYRGELCEGGPASAHALNQNSGAPPPPLLALSAGGGDATHGLRPEACWDTGPPPLPAHQGHVTADRTVHAFSILPER